VEAFATDDTGAAPAVSQIAGGAAEFLLKQ